MMFTNCFKSENTTAVVPDNDKKKYLLVTFTLKFKRFDFEGTIPDEKDNQIYTDWMNIIRYEKNPSPDRMFQYMTRNNRYKQFVNQLVKELFNTTPLDIYIIPKVDGLPVSFTLDLPINGVEEKLNNADLENLFYLPGYAGDVISFPSKTNPEIILGEFDYRGTCKVEYTYDSIMEPNEYKNRFW